MYMRRIGAPISPNRHTLQDSYLPALSSLVGDLQRSSLKDVRCVSISCDGRKDRMRRAYLHVTIYAVVEVNGIWEILTIHPDLIIVPGHCTGEAVKYLVTESIESFVRSSVLMIFSFNMKSASQGLFDRNNDN